MNKKEEIELLVARLRNMNLPVELPSKLIMFKKPFEILREELLLARDNKNELLYKQLIDVFEEKALFGAKIQPEDWIKIEGEEYDKILHLIENTDLEIVSEQNSLHIYETRYCIENENYRTLYTIGDYTSPLIEKLL